jgi:hypothetical protein
VAATKPLISHILFIRLTNGNRGRTKHWTSAARERKRIEKELREDGQVREPFDFPVTLKVTRILGKGERLWDSESWQRGNLKELVDSLVAVGWFADDGRKYITRTEFEDDDTQRDVGPAVKLEVFKA